MPSPKSLMVIHPYLYIVAIVALGLALWALRRWRPGRTLHCSRIVSFVGTSCVWFLAGGASGVLSLCLPPLLDGMLAWDAAAAVTHTLDIVLLRSSNATALFVTVPVCALLSGVVGLIMQLVASSIRQRQVLWWLNAALAVSPICAVCALWMVRRMTAA
jgi:hypothetical protein